MKSFYHIIIALAMFATTLVSCSKEDMLVTVVESTQDNSATFRINLNFSVPDPIKITSRNVTSETIKSMTLLCFNGQGKLLSISEADVDTESKTLEAVITNNTRIIHLIANQNFEGSGIKAYETTEDDIIGMIGNEIADQSTQYMIYWARVEIPADTILSEWEPETIQMLRNQAKVTIESEKYPGTDQPYFKVEKFWVYNTSSQGTVAPYHSTNKFPTNGSSFDLDAWSKENYISLPDDNSDPISQQAFNNNPVYVYETSVDKTPYIILYGSNCDKDGTIKEPQYWRVSFTDAEGESLLIRRNHHYAVKITGVLSNGKTNADDAETANNAYLGISNELTAVTDGKASLTVQETYFAVADDTDNLTFIFSIKKTQKDAADIFEDGLKITWDEKNGKQTVSDMTSFVEYVGFEFTEKVKKNESTGGYEELRGKISIPLKSLGEDNQPLQGVVNIKYGDRLQRKVTVTVVPMFEFEFERTTNVDETLKPINPYTQPIATLTFTIPDEYPDEMYPFNVLISTNDFTITNASSAGLPIIYSGDGGYIESKEDDMGYKYVYQITDPNVRTHTINLISSHGNVIEVTELGKVILESKHFLPLVVDDISLLCLPKE